jgi:phosphopantothenoylcysteine decarboxylase
VIAKKPVLYTIVCAAPPAETIHEFIERVQYAGWDTCVIATPQATQWIDIPLLESLTGYVLRTDYKLPGATDPIPRADAMIVIPATFNTINKVADGIADTLATGILCEALGRGTPPLIMVPCLKMDLVRHPAFAKSIALLHKHGVVILHQPEKYKSPLIVPWKEIMEALRQVYHEVS